MSNEKGYTYIWMMFAVALAGVALAGGGQAWKTEARREKEKELLFIGEQFRLAIGSYYDQSPGAKRYPESLEKLISDNRFPTVTRHLRKIFHDPMTGAAEWGLITRPGVGLFGPFDRPRNDRPGRFVPSRSRGVDAPSVTASHTSPKIDSVRATFGLTTIY